MIAKQTVLPPGVLIELTAYPAQIFDGAAASVRMMRTQKKHETDDDDDGDDLKTMYTIPVECS